ncbi:glutamate receptor 2.5-like protein isoform X1 [Cinnamomum micranthum f. kanehirae]|uniref:Glutamate receptor 2.5-like protein isoform X1 n=1 Tax=Cinnamomum micranthum f. kanehirae TaxID=337451 RepID=A0A443PKQ8_9MAGN|nr:glutamate receptor 2.5-like protein isoform X1 [Cinnamomum micranthum f. kanehirae]
MTPLLLLVLCSLLSTAVESTAHGLLVNSTNGFKYCGWHRGKDNRQSPCRFMQRASGLLEGMIGSELHDTTYSENEVNFPLIVIANSSTLLPTGFPYSLFVAQNVYSERVIPTPGPNNERNMTSPYLISHENFANKNGQKEAMEHGQHIYYEQTLDQVVGHAIATTDTLNYSDSMHQFIEESDSIEININLITWELLKFAIIHLTCLGIMKLLKKVFSWISSHKRIIYNQDVRSVRLCLELILILMLLTTTLLAMSYTRSLNSMLNVEKLQPSTEDVMTEPGAFRNSSTNIAHGWISKEGKEKNNPSPGGDRENSANDREYATKATREKTYKKLRVRIPFKDVVHKFLKLNEKSRGKLRIMTSFSLVANFPYKVSGKFSPHNDHKDDEEYTGELIYELYSKVNDSVSFEDFMRMVGELKRSKSHVKNGKTNVKLRMLVPTKNTFHEFVKAEHDPKGNGMIVTGYSVDAFKEVMDSLPYPVSYEFFPYKNGHSNDMGYYDDLIQQLHLNRYDGVVGDITITSNRTKYGDFTLPYMTSGVSMIVPVVDSLIKNRWWFLKPLTWKLCLVTIVLSLSKGLLLWYFERENNEDFKGKFLEQMGKILSFSSIFVLAQNDKLKSNYSKLLMIFWIFGVFVLSTSYASELQSMITSNNDTPAVSDIEQLISNGDYVGYQKGSFVFGLLKHMGFQREKLKAYSSKEEYAMALSRGSHNNGVSAIIDEIPYIKIFLAEYSSRYTMAGPTFRPGGFGFLFHRGCAIVPDVSRAVQKFIEGEKKPELENKWFGYNEPNPPPPQNCERNTRLSLHAFLGVFIISELIPLTIAIISFVFNKCRFWKTKCSPSSDEAVEARQIEELFNRFYAEMNGSPINQGSHIVQGESNQATPNDSPLEVTVIQNECSHSVIAFQNKSFTCDEILHSFQSSPTANREITVELFSRRQAM